MELVGGFRRVNVQAVGNPFGVAFEFHFEAPLAPGEVDIGQREEFRAVHGKEFAVGLGAIGQQAALFARNAQDDLAIADPGDVVDAIQAIQTARFSFDIGPFKGSGQTERIDRDVERELDRVPGLCGVE